VGYFSENFSDRFDQQYLAAGTFRNWRHLVREYGGVDTAYRLRAWFVVLNTLLSKPLRLYEASRYRDQIGNTALKNPPIFIIGHWRSGTTYLHRLLCQNPGFEPVSMLHTVLPGMFITPSPFRSLLKRSIPEVRPMDNMSMGIDESEEDEYAMANLPGTSSYYNTLSFPREMERIFNDCVLFGGMDDAVVQHWFNTYDRFLRKVAMHTGADRLVLKNPANSARMPKLLEYFPGAKFVFLHRHPLTVFESTMHLMDHELDMLALQRASYEQVSRSVLTVYEKLIARYLSDREAIPRDQLCEIRFEDLEADPLGETLRIYESLNLEYASTMADSVSGYVASLGNYRKNEFHSTPGTRRMVERQWGFAYREWGYD